MTLCFCLRSVHCWRHCLSFEVYILMTRCPALLLQCQMHRQHGISIAMLASSACLLAAPCSGHAPWEALLVFGYAACILCAGKIKSCKVIEQAACLSKYPLWLSCAPLHSPYQASLFPITVLNHKEDVHCHQGKSLQDHPAKHEMTSKIGSSLHLIVVHACRQL